MKLTVFIFVGLFVIFGESSKILKEDNHLPAVNQQLIEHINSIKTSSWVAGVNQNFNGKTLASVKKMLGFIRSEKQKPTNPQKNSEQALPISFTSATNWPNCKTISTIFNQAECGSCWAFGGVAAASDRFCIVSKGQFNQALSFGQVTECTSGGCQGGSDQDTWDFIQNNGIVSDACYPYYIPTCPPAQQPCLNFVNTPNCWNNRTCVNGAAWTKYHVSNYYGLDTVHDIMNDIMTNGPVEACFDVYEDFLSYKSGVYVHTSGSYLGGHCIKIQGWGIENNQEYWLVNNSWTTFWGDNGQFKILRGQDECGIEDDVVAGTPTYPPSQEILNSD